MTTYLIDFIDNATDEDISGYFSANNCVVKKHLSNLKKIYMVESSSQPPKTNIVQWVINDDAATVQLLDANSIQPSYTDLEKAQVDVNAEKDWWKLYSLFKVDFSSATITPPIHKTDNVVFVLDSGIKANHPEFVGRRVELFHSFLGTDFDDNNGHGTALASLINGNTCSITDCDLKVVKIFDKNVPTKQSDILTALNEIGTFITNNPNKLVVLNMSWSIPKNDFIESKIQVLSFMGAAIVAAAGNSGQPIADVTPAGMNEAITIGSYNSSFLPSNFSNYQNPTVTSLTQNSTNHGELDGWAPGESIYVATIDSANPYGFSAGTSLSAAIFSAGLVYNSIGMCVETNTYEVSKLVGIDPITTMSQNTLYREHLLDLSDPKYALCKNRVVTYFSLDNAQTNLTLSDDFTMKVLVDTTKAITKGMFNPEIAKSFEWLTPIPNWVYRHGDYLIFNPKTEPVNDRDFYELKLQLNGTGNSEGKVTVVTFEVLHMPSDFDYDTVPENDPILDYQLQAFGQLCQKNCVNDCPTNINQCCGEFQLKAGCYCAPQGGC